MFLSEKIEDKDIKVFEILDKEGSWIISIYRDEKLEYSVKGKSLPHLYRAVLDKYK